MKGVVTFGIIGAGRIGQLHARLLQHNVQNARVKTICDIDLEAAQLCSKKVNAIHATDRVQDVLDDTQIDAVLISSSTDTHAALIQQAADKRKHIFCEKPIAFDAQVVKETLRVVERANVKLQVGFNRRFDPNFARVRQIVESGEIGELNMIRITSRDPAPPPIEYIQKSGGLFFDMTIHDFDMARFLSGSEVVEVFARGTVLVDQRIVAKDDIDTAAISLVFANGALGMIENCRRAVYGYDQRVEVLGSKGMADAGNVLSNTVTVSTDSHVRHDLAPFFFVERYSVSYANQFIHFVDCLLNDKNPSVSGQDGLEPVYLAQACYKSMREKRSVSLSEVKG